MQFSNLVCCYQQLGHIFIDTIVAPQHILENSLLDCYYNFHITLSFIPPLSSHQAHRVNFFQNILGHFLIITSSIIIIMSVIPFISRISNSIYFSPGMSIKKIGPIHLINGLINTDLKLIYSMNINRYFLCVNYYSKHRSWGNSMRDKVWF